MVEQAVDDPLTFRLPIRVDALAAYSRAAAETNNQADLFVRMGELIRDAREAMLATTHAAAVLQSLRIVHEVDWSQHGAGSHYVIIHIPDPRQAAQFKLASGATSSW